MAPATPRFARSSGGRDRGAAAPADSARRAVWLLGAVLALESADLATVGAVGDELERSLGISHSQLGLLAAVGPLMAAAGTLPAGVIADRFRRTPLLAASVGLWAAAMLAGGLAGSFAWLLASRAALGVLTATATPMLLSLSGDYFPSAERARRYSRIAAGELVGAGFGFLVSGNVAAILSWRWAFWVLVPPALALALALWRHLPEPPRGGDPETHREGLVHEQIARQGAKPREHQVLSRDPARMSLPQAMRYVLRVRANVMLILAAATSNFFFAGVRTFTVLFIRGHYGLPQAAATSAMGVLGLGALAGVLLGGRAADALLSRGRLDARLIVAGAATIAAAVIWVGPLLFTVVWLGLLVGIPAAAAMSMPTAPVDAARLDVIPARLRGRAESVRALLRALAFAVAPLAFGFIADAFAGPRSAGPQAAFLFMLVPLGLSGFLLLAARRPYPRDVASAIASDERADGRRRRAGGVTARPAVSSTRPT